MEKKVKMEMKMKETRYDPFNNQEKRKRREEKK